ncbi:hypothetical protein FRC19_006422 [Serendipita sp. 401]|nr:hypothetical protein FRC19_006422 [Serendipita sp. 401]KAG9050163.1 hypothetical protein FS842_011394 [Serendipita sp. 407]
MNHIQPKQRRSRASKPPLVQLRKVSSLDAPNLLSQNESHQLGQNFDWFGGNEENEVFWNSHLDTFGLVCSPSKEVNDSVVKRLIASHIHITDGPVLILRASKGLPVPKGCALAISAQAETNSRYNVIISPRDLESMQDLYSSSNTTPVSLALEEKDVETRHLLALFTSMPSINDDSRTLDAIRNIISQLGRPFNLEEFNWLVEGGTWDSEGDDDDDDDDDDNENDSNNDNHDDGDGDSDEDEDGDDDDSDDEDEDDYSDPFVTLRQTILAKLLSSEDGIQLDSIFDLQREIIVDLSDPVLSETRLDEVLMDIVLWSFLKHHEGKKGLIVIDNSQDFLNAESVLTQSLESLARQGPNRIMKVILSTTDLSKSPPSIISTLDYYFCGYSWGPLWRHTLSNSLDIPLDLKTLQEGEVALVCPSNSVLSMEEGKKPEGASTYILLHIDEFQSSMPQILKTSTMNGSHPLHLPTTRPSETRDNITAEGVMSPLIGSKECAPINPTLGTVTITDKQSLVSAVRSLSGGQVGNRVKYGSVRKQFNLGRDLTNATSSSFRSVVQATCKEGLIEHLRIDGRDFMSLKPVPLMVPETTESAVELILNSSAEEVPPRTPSPLNLPAEQTPPKSSSPLTPSS